MCCKIKEIYTDKHGLICIIYKISVLHLDQLAWIKMFF